MEMGRNPRLRLLEAGHLKGVFFFLLDLVDGIPPRLRRLVHKD
jgi:hypothetical protein